MKDKTLPRTKIDFDMEFTGLHQRTSPISIGLVVEHRKASFYAEFTDYKKSQVNAWLRKHVINNLVLTADDDFDETALLNGAYGAQNVNVRGTHAEITSALLMWLASVHEQFGAIEFWSDCLSYDWVLLAELIADMSEGYPQLPEGVFYLPFDIFPLFRAVGVDPDITREDFAPADEMLARIARKHNALWDAMTIQRCREELEVLMGGDRP